MNWAQKIKLVLLIMYSRHRGYTGHGEPYSEHEDLLIANRLFSDKKIAKLTDRTEKAIKKRRDYMANNWPYL